MSLILPSQLLSQGRAERWPLALEGDCRHDYADFAAAVAGLSCQLQAQPQQRYALLCQNAWHFAVGLFALWHAAKQVVVPNNALPGTLAALSGAFDAVLGDDAVRNAAGAGVAGGLPPLPAERCRIDLYTSGSTGEPKRIAKTLRQFEAEVQVLESLWGDALGAAPVLATVPHHHIYGLLFRILWPLAAGRAFDVDSYATPEPLLARAQRLGRVAVVASPAQLARFPDLIPLAALTPHLSRCFSSGGPLSEATALRFLQEAGVSPTEVFGSTETGGIAWRCQRAGDSAWTPLPQVQCRSAADGALELCSPFLPDAQPWLSADQIAWQADGRFLLQGRLDRVVKLEEKRLSLPEQEARLATHHWVAACSLLLLAQKRQTLCAAVVLSTAGEQQLRQLGKLKFGRLLRQHLAHWYEAVLLPRRWRFVAALPLNERGKLCRVSLNRMFEVEDATP